MPDALGRRRELVGAGTCVVLSRRREVRRGGGRGASRMHGPLRLRHSALEAIQRNRADRALWLYVHVVCSAAALGLSPLPAHVALMLALQVHDFDGIQLDQLRRKSIDHVALPRRLRRRNGRQEARADIVLDALKRLVGVADDREPAEIRRHLLTDRVGNGRLEFARQAEISREGLGKALGGERVGRRDIPLKLIHQMRRAHEDINFDQHAQLVFCVACLGICGCGHGIGLLRAQATPRIGIRLGQTPARIVVLTRGAHTQSHGRGKLIHLRLYGRLDQLHKHLRRHAQILADRRSEQVQGRLVLDGIPHERITQLVRIMLNVQADRNERLGHRSETLTPSQLRTQLMLPLLLRRIQDLQRLSAG